MPALLGEVDIIKSIQFLPGVTSVGEGASGFNVRGGGIDQNLVLLDEAPVYNSSHLFGFFSVFNPDAVKDVKLIKGGIPSNYGGRISSILDNRSSASIERYGLSGHSGERSPSQPPKPPLPRAAANPPRPKRWKPNRRPKPSPKRKLPSLKSLMKRLSRSGPAMRLG